MQIPAEAVKVLREQTGAGIMECKRALEESKGDVAKATAILKGRGYAVARKKESRATGQGLIEAYVHGGGRIGALVEVNCESDFVARTLEFKELAHDLAMQVVAGKPKFLSREDVPAGVDVADEECLMLQPFIKDPAKKVQDIITEAIAKFRENIKVKRFVRFELGLDGQDT